jgi:hypothetical protein
MTNWPFSDPPDTAVFTGKKVVGKVDWIYYVTHDREDGAWQFHGQSGPTPEAEASVVGLGTMIRLDPSLEQLADLPLGWCASRQGPTAPWERREL